MHSARRARILQKMAAAGAAPPVPAGMPAAAPAPPTAIGSPTANSKPGAGKQPEAPPVLAQPPPPLPGTTTLTHDPVRNPIAHLLSPSLLAPPGSVLPVAQPHLQPPPPAPTASKSGSKAKTALFEALNKLAAAHSNDKCMECKKAPPKHDIRWCEGRARAWFCDPCFASWKSKGDGFHEVDAHKAIPGGVAGKKFGEGPRT